MTPKASAMTAEGSATTGAQVGKLAARVGRTRKLQAQMPSIPTSISPPDRRGIAVRLLVAMSHFEGLSRLTVGDERRENP